MYSLKSKKKIEFFYNFVQLKFNVPCGGGSVKRPSVWKRAKESGKNGLARARELVKEIRTEIDAVVYMFYVDPYA